MPHATCEACGDLFWRRSNESWKRLCLSCWLARKREREEAQNAEVFYLRWQITELEEELKAKERQLETLRTCLEPISVNWRFLISCAHPDCHGGRPEATEITRALLQLRDIFSELRG